MIKRKGLGMGLDALLGSSDPAEPAARDTSDVRSSDVATIPLIALAQIQAGHYQPRDRFDDAALQTLADSIREHGVLQPILVRLRADAAHPYEILAGERRFRAAGIAGLTHIPAIIREADNEQALALGLIENIQRQDLNPLEEARAIQRLVQEFDYTHEAAATAIGRSRSATSNLLRLLSLSDPVQENLISGELEMGHARALLAVGRADQIMLANRIIERQLSVRETEAEVTAHLESQNNAAETTTGSGRSPASLPPLDRDLIRLQERLSDVLAAPVSIRSNRKGRGKLVIEFAGHEQFEGLLGQLGLRSQLDK
ncbi:MAG: ParB/RepB/Spo0J family partition protein [Burkholderiaceae bacterium]